METAIDHSLLYAPVFTQERFFTVKPASCPASRGLVSFDGAIIAEHNQKIPEKNLRTVFRPKIFLIMSFSVSG
jgi:hypothetical protein